MVSFQAYYVSFDRSQATLIGAASWPITCQLKAAEGLANPMMSRARYRFCWKLLTKKKIDDAGCERQTPLILRGTKRKLLPDLAELSRRIGCPAYRPYRVVTPSQLAQLLAK